VTDHPIFDFVPYRQGRHRYEASIFAVGHDGARWRVKLVRDAYDHQSWVKAQRFDGAEWHDVREGSAEIPDLPSYVDKRHKQEAAARDFCDRYLMGTWERTIGLPYAEPTRVVGEPGLCFVLELVVQADDLEHAGLLARDAAEFLGAGDVDVSQYEAHPFEPAQ